MHKQLGKDANHEEDLGLLFLAAGSGKLSGTIARHADKARHTGSSVIVIDEPCLEVEIARIQKVIHLLEAH